MIRKDMIVVCTTDERHQCRAAFEVKDRKEATRVRKHLYRILPPKFCSSVGAWAETKQHHIQRGVTTSAQIGYPVPPTKWFAPEDALPSRFEDLLLPPELIRDWLEDRKRQMQKKPWWYWWLPDWKLWRPKL